MSPKSEEHEHELILRQPDSSDRRDLGDVNTDLFYKTESAFYAFAARSNMPDPSKSPMEKHADMFLKTRAIPAKTLNLKPESDMTSRRL